eukprot:3706709-Prymnesium_polylepis.1
MFASWGWALGLGATIVRIVAAGVLRETGDRAFKFNKDQSYTYALFSLNTSIKLRTVLLLDYARGKHYVAFCSTHGH